MNCPRCAAAVDREDAYCRACGLAISFPVRDATPSSNRVAGPLVDTRDVPYTPAARAFSTALLRRRLIIRVGLVIVGGALAYPPASILLRHEADAGVATVAPLFLGVSLLLICFGIVLLRPVVLDLLDGKFLRTLGPLMQTTGRLLPEDDADAEYEAFIGLKIGDTSFPSNPRLAESIVRSGCREGSVLHTRSGEVLEVREPGGAVIYRHDLFRPDVGSTK